MAEADLAAAEEAGGVTDKNWGPLKQGGLLDKSSYYIKCQSQELYLH